MTIQIIPIHIKQEIQKCTDIIKYFISGNIQLETNDILVISQKIISKQEGKIVKLSSITPSILSIGIALEYNKDPRIIEIMMMESKRIVKMKDGVIIVKTKHGFICANAGIDESNVQHGYVTLLPMDADKSAQIIRNKIYQITNKKIAVIISDTFGRPFRLGQTDFAIGTSGINLLANYIGMKDTFDRSLRVTSIAIVDEICSAAELVMGKINHCPAAIIRNYKFDNKTNCKINNIFREYEDDLFI